jgi:hypothetical protein
MSYDVTLKRGDTRHAIRAILKDSSGSPVDLTDCSVSFRMAPLGRPPTISRQVDIHDAAGRRGVGGFCTRRNRYIRRIIEQSFE